MLLSPFYATFEVFELIMTSRSIERKGKGQSDGSLFVYQAKPTSPSLKYTESST